MPLVIDTFNLLHTTGILPADLAGIDVPGVALLILRSRHRGQRVTFVCDGLPAADLPPPGALTIPDDQTPSMGESADAGFTVRYAGKSATADDLIRDIVSASTAPRRLTIVSSDHEIQRHARKRRCVVLTSEDFLQHLADDADLPRGPRASKRAIPPAMTTEQVERWIDVFQLDQEMLEVPATPPPSDPIVGGTLGGTKQDPPRPRDAPATPSSPAAPKLAELSDEELRELEKIDMNALLPPNERPSGKRRDKGRRST